MFVTILTLTNENKKNRNFKLQIPRRTTEDNNDKLHT